TSVVICENGSAIVCEVSVNPFIFFFQAEDGIRDLTVTGVQTCALPILRTAVRRRHVRRAGGAAAAGLPGPAAARGPARGADRHRSEERRVGKECRSRWWPYDKKKINMKRRQKSIR